MDQITGISDLFVKKVDTLCVETEPDRPDNDDLYVETAHLSNSQQDTLYVETYNLKRCSVRMVSLESILREERRAQYDAAQSVQSTKETDSEATEAAASDENAESTPALPTGDTPPTSQNTTDPTKAANADEPAIKAASSMPPPTQKPASTEVTRKTRSYGCRLCDTRVDSAAALKEHHGLSHGIMYCSSCNKAFNNQLSLTRHQYEHKPRPYECKYCEETFPFESQYNTHLLTHSDRRRHTCTYEGCEKRFKNKGDRNRHLKEHTSDWIKCPDCPDYKTKEKRNFESHRLKHSKIERYWCELCGQGFTYNTQKIRHITKKLCKKLKS